MFLRKKKYNSLNKSIDDLSDTLEKGNIHELIYILGSKKEVIIRNFIAGIFRGIGIGIGVTLISAILIALLQRIVKLNIPVIGEYVSDIVEIVQKSRWLLTCFWGCFWGHFKKTAKFLEIFCFFYWQILFCIL